MADSFHARVRTEGDVPILELEGRIDGSAESALLAGWDAAVTTAGDRVILDFEAVDYINSTGLAVLVQLLARARATGVAVHAVGLTEHYREIFDITRLSDFVTVHPDRAAALA
jgi:anti-anti-sigma factor